MKYIVVIAVAIAVVLGALLINMGVNHGCLPWEDAERLPQRGLETEWECR